MSCPFQDSTQGALCLVLRIARDRTPVCTKSLSDLDQVKGYRHCSLYGTAISGGLTVLLRMGRNNHASAPSTQEATA